MALNIRERTEELEYAYLAPQAAKSRAARRKEKGEELQKVQHRLHYYGIFQPPWQLQRLHQ